MRRPDPEGILIRMATARGWKPSTVWHLASSEGRPLCGVRLWLQDDPRSLSEGLQAGHTVCRLCRSYLLRRAKR